MLRIVVSQSADAAKSYFKRDDYLSEFGESPGVWFGTGARRLGLTGVAAGSAFDRLCDNLHPVTGEKLTPRMKANRRPGFDWSFDVPKSVSLAHALGGDDRIVEAFTQAVLETLAEMEQRVRTRVRVDGQNSDRETANIVGTYFLHQTARPVNGVADPQLHIHAYVMNQTHDPIEDRWKALEIVAVKEQASYYEAGFHARLARNLRQLGYDIASNGRYFEIAGIPPTAIRKFSRRRALIDAVARETGIADDPDARARLGVETRELKSTELGLSELRPIWMSRLDREERSALHAVVRDARERAWSATRTGARAASLESFDERDPGTVAAAEQRALDFALRHCLERASVAAEHEVLAAALRFGVGVVEPVGIKMALDARNELVRSSLNGMRCMTTPEAVEEERRIVRWAQDGRDNRLPLCSRPTFVDPSLSEEQLRAVRHVVLSRDRITGICGRAGTGKTRMMQAAIASIESAGVRVVTVAPTARAARDTLRGEGFAHADTIATLLMRPELQERCRNGVIWVDEAGLVTVPVMGKLFDLADALNARLVLTGDVRQHGPVGRGEALRLLTEHEGCIDLAQLSGIRRQSGRYREAVAHLAEGHVIDGVQVLDEIGAIRELGSDERYALLADDYLETLRGGHSALIVSPTHAEEAKVTEAIRERLRDDGRISDERECTVLHRLELTAAERASMSTYDRANGWIIEFVKPAKGVRAGERWEILNAYANGLYVRDATGRERLVHPEAIADRVQVFEHRRLAIGVGDTLRFTKNVRAGKDRQRRIHNGTVVTVVGVDRRGGLRLSNGITLAGDEAHHLTHAYACTSHVAQGVTVDWVFVCQGSDSIGASSMEQFYVSVSRGRRGVRVYTDDRELLLDAVQRSCRRTSALELEEAASASSIRAQEQPEPAEPDALKGRLGTVERGREECVLTRDLFAERHHELLHE
ncbi:MAG: MobF family relaxase [Phycisphaerales bacterium]